MHTTLAHIAMLLALCGIATPGWGVAVYSTGASSTFSIGIGVVEIGSNSISTTEVGTGAAAVFRTISPDGAFPATISVGVAGSASAPPTSFAESIYMGGHVIRIDNSDPMARDISVRFAFTYSWITTISVSNPALEFASSGAFFGISGFEPGIDSIDIDGDGMGAITDSPGTSAWLFNPTFATSLGETGTGGVLSGAIEGVINVAAGEIGTFSVITDATGRAFARVPEPGTLALASLGLVAALVVRRRRVPHHSARIPADLTT